MSEKLFTCFISVADTDRGPRFFKSLLETEQLGYTMMPYHTYAKRPSPALLAFLGDYHLLRIVDYISVDPVFAPKDGRTWRDICY